MSTDVPIQPCRYCGTPKRIDTWCGTNDCAERVATAQAELHALIFGMPNPTPTNGAQP